MTKQEYNVLRGWKMPSDENPKDEGYLVEYLDGGKPNHPDYEGYISWSPKEVFEKTYRQTDGLTFGQAIELMKQGKKLTRKGWNGKGMFLLLITGKTVSAVIWDAYGGKDNGESIPVLDSIYMKTADDNLVTWLASQTDMLAEDWQVVD